MTPQPTAEAAQSAPSVIPSGEIDRFAYVAGLGSLAFSMHFRIGALLHGALIGWTIDWTSLVGVLVLIAWPAFPIGVALLLSGVISVLRWLAGKLRGRR